MTPEQIQSRRDQILAAATSCFARKGCAQSTMQDVAEEAGLSVGALYRYFPGKDDLISSVFERIEQRTGMLFTRAAEGTRSPGEVLRKAGLILEQRLADEVTKDETVLVLEAILAAAREPGRVGVGAAEGGGQLRDVYVFLTENLFRQAQEEGALDPEVDVRGLATLFVSLMVGIHVLHLELGDALGVQPLMSTVDEMLSRMGTGATPGLATGFAG